MNEKRKKKKRTKRTSDGLFSSEKSDSTFCDKSLLVPLLLLLYSCLVSSNRKLYHRSGDTICPSIEKRVELARSCDENIFRYRKEGGIVDLEDRVDTIHLFIMKIRNDCSYKILYGTNILYENL